MAERFVIISKDGYSNLRKEASTNSKVLAKVDNSYLIYNANPYNENKDWYFVQIKRDGNYSEVGYIHKSQLGIHPETYVTSSKDDYVNLRSKPSASSKVLAQLEIGDYVTRYPEKTVGDWYYVDYDDKMYYVDQHGGFQETVLYSGYIHKSQLGKHQEIYVTSSKDDHINVRAKPNTSLQILVTLDSGMYVRRYPEKTVGDWYYVNYGLEGAIAPITTEGYIHKSQLKKEKQ